jgi:Na+/H+ antiporter NhaD/arsenite permease-like protein
MSTFHATITICVFAGVILAIAFDLLDLTLSALLGVSVLLIMGILTPHDVLKALEKGGGALALLFGGMVVARTLQPTGVFENVGTRFLILIRGSGRLYLLGLFVLIAPICAFLPNATVVILVAPIIIRIAKELDVDYVGPMVLTAIISNSAGMLTLVGDPATFLVGSSIGMTFNEYLRRVSLGGVLALAVLVPLLPLIMKDIWNVQRPLPKDLKVVPIQRPGLAAAALFVLVGMVVMFLIGENMPVRIVPPSVAIIGASLALLVIYGARVEPIEHVMKDVDWKTLIFIGCMFFMVEEFTRTGILQGLSKNLFSWFGVNTLLVGLVLLAGVGAASSLLANIPVVAAMIMVTKGYCVVAQLVPEKALGAAFIGWPLSTLPVFMAMMFGATLGGNATLIGASANVVAAGICSSRGRSVSFATFMRYGLPLTLCQLAVSALYVLTLYYLLHR